MLGVIALHPVAAPSGLGMFSYTRSLREGAVTLPREARVSRVDGSMA